MSKHSHIFEDHLKFAVTCPLCRAAYDPLEANVVEGDDGAELVHVECRRCRGAVVALITASPHGVTSVGVVTDLSSHDLVRVRAQEEVTGDDVLSLYTFLEKDRGRQFLHSLHERTTHAL